LTATLDIVGWAAPGLAISVKFHPSSEHFITINIRPVVPIVVSAQGTPEYQTHSELHDFRRTFAGEVLSTTGNTQFVRREFRTGNKLKERIQVGLSTESAAQPLTGHARIRQYAPGHA
jgi:hypothetical protein